METVATIKVGPEEKIFLIHSSFLSAASTFFKAAITGKFEEASANEIKLPEDCAETFEHFIRWLYSGCKEDPTPTEDRSICSARIKRIIDLYVFADKIGCQELQQEMVRDLYHLAVESRPFNCPVDSVEYLYSCPIPAEPLREITVALWVWYIDVGVYKKEACVQSLLARAPEFAQEALIEMSRRFGEEEATNPLKSGVDHFLAKI